MSSSLIDSLLILTVGDEVTRTGGCLRSMRYEKFYRFFYFVTPIHQYPITETADPSVGVNFLLPVGRVCQWWIWGKTWSGRRNRAPLNPSV